MISYATLANLYILEEQYTAAIHTLEKLRDYDREIVLRFALTLAGCNISEAELIKLSQWFDHAGRIKKSFPHYLGSSKRGFAQTPDCSVF